MSLFPRDPFFEPFSWKIKTGLLRRTGDDGDDHLVYQVNPGGGISYRLGKGSLVYFLGEPDFILGSELEHSYALGIGASAGFLTNVTKEWKIHLFGREIYYGLGDEHNAWEAGLHQNLTLGTNTSLRLELGLSRIHGYDRNEVGLSWNIYF